MAADIHQDEPKELNAGWWRGAGRALLLRCPRCGRAPVFRRFVVMNDQCAECQLDFDRGDGYWLGAMMFNMAFSLGFVLLAFAAAIWLTSPAPDWDPTIIVTVAAAAAGPLVFFPFSRTLWMAAERAARLRDGTEHD